MAGQEQDPLARLFREVGAALERAKQSPSFRALLELAERQQRSPFSTMDPDKFASQVAELLYEKHMIGDRLPHILLKASRNAGRLYDFINDPDAVAKRSGRSRASMLRIAATLRDSLDQVAQIVGGEQLTEPPKREWEREGWEETAVRGPDEEARVFDDEVTLVEDVIDAYMSGGNTERELRSAHAFLRIKSALQQVEKVPEESKHAVWANIKADLTAALNLISGQAPIPGKENVNVNDS